MATSSKDPGVIKNKIAAAMRGGDVRKAVSLSGALVKLPRTSVGDCLEVVEFAKQIEAVDLALIAMRQARRRQPRDLHLLLELARLEEHFCQRSEAVRHLDEAQALCGSAEEFDRLANLLSRMGEMERAREMFGAALAAQPGNNHIKSNCAIAAALVGRDEEAERLYDEVITAGGAAAINYLNRSWLRKQTEDRNHVEELQRALEAAGDRHADAPYLHYALGKELEDLGRFDEAFANLEKGASLRRGQINYSVDADLGEFARIEKVFDEEAVAGRGKASDSDEPIFILGLPRTGSTLVERIVSAHSQVFAAGELQGFGRAVRMGIFDTARRKGLYQGFDQLEMARDADMRTLARTYLRSTRPRTGRVAHFTDKQPRNFIYIGMIAAAFPNAKIIHTHRSPMDTCFAMFKQLFLNRYNFSYDQKELGAYYLGYRRLMEHWDRALPGRLIHVGYEDLVQDNERVARDLIGRLGLEWEDACLDHTASAEASPTASAMQVRQPVYTTSVGKWREFGDRLTVLRQTLEAGGLEVH